MTAAKPVAPISKDAYDIVVKSAETQYKVDKDACSSRSGNAKDICLAEANGKEKVARADAEGAYENTPKAREDMRAHGSKRPTTLPSRNVTHFRAIPRMSA